MFPTPTVMPMSTENRVNDVLPPGYILLWYEFCGVIGRGSYGVTYLCFDKNLHRKVAIKEYLPMDFACRQENDTVNPLTDGHKELFTWGLERFLVEARTLAKFNHPNIIKVLSIFEENNTAYMVMEYEDGNNLAEVYQKKSHFNERELLDIIVPVVEGLALVHKAGFIHRDIKPSNIYLRKNGSSVLLDFGSARQTLGSRTRALTTLVTSGYAPFEQYNQSEDEQGTWTDVYALGATLYFCVTGNKPTDALMRGSALLRSQQDNYQPILNTDDTGYSDNFLAAINNALKFHADSRPQDAQQWLDMLKGRLDKNISQDTLANQVIDPNDTATIVVRKQVNRVNSGTGNKLEQSGSLLKDQTVRPDTDKSEVLDLQKLRDSISKSKKATENKKFLAAGLQILKQLGESSSRSIEPIISLVKNKKIAAMLGAIAFLLILRSTTNLFSIDATADKNLESASIVEELPEPVAITSIAEQTQKSKIDNLLALAEIDMSENRYVGQADNNAVFRYQQVLALQPGHTGALEGIDNIIGNFGDRVEEYITADDYQQASDTIATISFISPNHSILGGLQTKLTEAENDSNQIASLLKKAGTAFKRKKLTQPTSRSALTYYRQVLEIDAGNADAIAGISDIVDVLSIVLSNQLKKNKINSAKITLSKIESIDSSSPLVNTGKLQISEFYQKRRKIKKLLLSAKKDFIRGKLVRPQGNNALAKYRQVLQMNRYNKQAKEGVDMIYGYYVSSVYQYIDDSRFKKAQNTLKTLKQIGYGHRQITSLNNIISEKMIESTETVSK